MIKGVFVFVYGLIVFFCPEKQIRVVERASAMLIEPGYYIAESDTTFEFMNRRYVIKTREFFNVDEIINRVAILKPLGYLEFSEGEIISSKKFLDNFGFSRTIKAHIIDDDHISVNKKPFVVKRIDRKRKRIFYSPSRKNDTLYYLVYK